MQQALGMIVPVHTGVITARNGLIRPRLNASGFQRRHQGQEGIGSIMQTVLTAEDVL